MICTKCFHGKTQVTNSRPHKTSPSIWRRRQCLKCSHIFTTLETPDTSEAATISGKPFSAPRLTVSLAGYLSHRGNEAPDDASWLVATVQQLMWAEHKKKLTSRELVDMVYPILDRFDAIAGLRYATEHGLISGQQQKPRRGRPRITHRP
jgi:transcriptional regulator NrdR family protein